MLTFRQYFYIFFIVEMITIKATDYQMDDRGSIQGMGWIILLF
jgi:hypothetical protein